VILFMIAAMVLHLVGGPHPSQALDTAAWERFKARFVTGEGRVVDIYQNNISHSEGQGFALLLAVAHDDRSAFDALWAWTRASLQTRPADSLASWAYGQAQDGTWRVLDPNNATDGDLFLAWALLAAHQRWGLPGAEAAARAVAGDIERLLVREQDGYLVLLPGEQGFVGEQATVFNPSYFCFSALRRLARLEGGTRLSRVRTDALALLENSRTGVLRLPPDWAVLTEGGVVRPWPERPPLFSYDAIRIPLYLAWAGERAALELARPLIALALRPQGLPARLDLATGEAPADQTEPASAGYYAVLARAAAALGATAEAGALWDKARGLVEQEGQNYYSNVLFLLASLETLP